MKTTKQLLSGLISLTMLLTGLSFASADESDYEQEFPQGQMQHQRDNGQGRFGQKNFGQRMKDFNQIRKNVEHEVTNLENGIRITITSDDATIVEKLQNRQQLESRNDSVTKTQTNIENGVQIDITSTDPSEVERIQSQKNRPKRGSDFFGERRMEPKDATQSVVKIDNGVVVTITSDNAETVERLQSHEPAPKNEDVIATKENIENGVIITKTSTDAEIVEKMHEMVDRQEMRDDIERSVENIDNGVVMTITSKSGDAATIEHIQNKPEPKGPKNEEVTVTKENIENGVKVTITSDNADLVERIQNREQGPKKVIGNKRGKRGMKRGLGRGQKIGVGTNAGELE